MANKYIHFINGKEVPFTEEEIVKRKAEEKEANDKSAQYKLEEIRKIRNRKLSETDYLANSDVTMPDNIKTWRQALRDIPQTYTTEDKYDELLATDEQGNLTHTVWEKP